MCSRVHCDGIFSDLLYRPFFCANIQISPYIAEIPIKNTMTRLARLSPEEFESKYADKPFILTEQIKEWSVCAQWSIEYLQQRYGSTEFRAEAVNWSLNVYVDYMISTTDESPLYLFDRSFAEKMDLRVGRGGDYEAPECFGDDLFTVLGDQRPDHRWLIIGPERSGSTFHKDPNATSAWNAVIRGAKYWIMFPGSKPPPGVYVSKDQSEVTSPLSIAEWLIGFHAEARMMEGCVEGICGEGEVLHVPSGWWHLVVNLESSIAITQNFVPKAHLGKVVDFLRNKADQVSGFHSDEKTTLWDLFAQKLEHKHPGLIAECLAKGRTLNGKRKWSSIIDTMDEDGSSAPKSFSFGFTGNGDSDDADVP